MLQRAANDAYSWWWASHIRTKQSKWLEQSLQDQEEKTQYVLGLIQEEGDSFAKRAEMYYKRRPELGTYVEESYRAFRALAERYDHLSTELQNANNTLATCFPEQFQMPMDDDDFDSMGAPRFPKQVPPSDPSDVPKVPKEPLKKLKGIIATAAKQSKTQKVSKASGSDSSGKKSGLSKNEALDEIDTLQKDILALQTVKEFVKSSYQSGLEKFYDIENSIMEKQQRVGQLQDEFGVEKVIEDDEARKLMAEAAIKSCQETLSKLQETQQKSSREAKEEGNKIEDAREKIKSIRHRFLPDAEKNPSEKHKSIKKDEKEGKELGQIAQGKIQVDASSMSSITVSELAEKIDELVSNVISLEDAVSSQTALIERLRSEARELHANIQSLEDDKSNLKEGTRGLDNKVKELEHQLSGIQDLNQNIESQNSNIDTHFVDAQCSLNNLSEKLSSVELDEEPESVAPPQHQKSVHNSNTFLEDKEKQKDQTSIEGKGIIGPSEMEDVDVKGNTKGKGVDVSPTESKGITNPSGTGCGNVEEHNDGEGVTKSPIANPSETEHTKEEEGMAKANPYPSETEHTKEEEGMAKSSIANPSETEHTKQEEGMAKSSIAKPSETKHTKEEEGMGKSPIDVKGIIGPSETGDVNVQEDTKGKRVAISPIESKGIDNPSETRDGNVQEHNDGKGVARSPIDGEGIIGTSEQEHTKGKDGGAISPTGSRGISNPSETSKGIANPSETSKGIIGTSEIGDANVQEHTKGKEGGAISPTGSKGITNTSETRDGNAQENIDGKGVAKSPIANPFETGDKNVHEHNYGKGVTKSPIDNLYGTGDPSGTGDGNVQEHNDGKGVAKSPIGNPFETGDGNVQENIDGEEVVESATSKTVTCDDPKMGNNMDKQTETVSEESREIKDSKDEKEMDELSCQMMLLSGDEDRVNILVKEYTTILSNYKEVKKKLDDMEKQNDDSIQIKELKYAIGKRDEEIQNLRRKLNEMQGNNDKSPISGDKEGDDNFSFILSEPEPFSEVEERLRTDIDSILDENLGFWLRFSSAFHQIQKFQRTVEDLQGEITQIREKQQQEEKDPTDVKSEVRPIYKHLKEIQAELEMWLEKCASLKVESERRFSSLCSIQEKISGALKESVVEDDIIFSSHQAAKFQGEVLNMAQENNKVKEELKEGCDHITGLKGEVDNTLTKLNDEFELSGKPSSPLGRLPSGSKVPLQLFIFGSKSKGKKPSLFSRMHHHRKYQALRAGLPP